jgi:hypothetical protein
MWRILSQVAMHYNEIISLLVGPGTWLRGYSRSQKFMRFFVLGEMPRPWQFAEKLAQAEPPPPLLPLRGTGGQALHSLHVPAAQSSALRNLASTPRKGGGTT